VVVQQIGLPACDSAPRQGMLKAFAISRVYHGVAVMQCCWQQTCRAYPACQAHQVWPGCTNTFHGTL
jgi:hypothetical protein